MVGGPAASLGGFIFGHDWGSKSYVGFCCLFGDVSGRHLEVFHVGFLSHLFSFIIHNYPVIAYFTLTYWRPGQLLHRVGLLYSDFKITTDCTRWNVHWVSSPLESLSAVGCSMWVREEVFYLSLSNYFPFGSFFYNRKLR